jgi:DNA polymerase III epsilon subunit-like protein
MLYVIDTETTGVTASDQVVQLAMIQIPDRIAELQSAFVPAKNFTGLELRKHSPYFPKFIVENNYFNPTVKINPFAQKVHGLSKIKLSSYPKATTCKMPDNTRLVVAHNAPFDTRMLGITHLKSICTMGLAKRIEKIQGGKFGFDNYQLFTIFVFFYPELKQQFTCETHDALADCEMALLVLLKLLQQFPFLATLTEVQEYFWSDK